MTVRGAIIIVVIVLAWAALLTAALLMDHVVGPVTQQVIR